MGFSGFYQFWCKNSHYWTVDSNEPSLQYSNEEQKCPICNEVEIFQNIVNQTNGSFDDEKRIDGFIKPELIDEQKLICPCGNEHICSCSTYKIPEVKK